MNRPQKWPNCPMKGLWVWILGTQTPLCSAPRSKPFAGTPVGRVQDQDQDQDDEQEHVRSPKPANSCNNSHPLNGWFGLAKDCDVTIIGKGVRHSDFKQNGHEEKAILLKAVVAPTRYQELGAGREAPEVDLIIPTHPYLKIQIPGDFLTPEIARP